MQEFQDSLGHRWSIEINIGTNNRVFRPIGLDLLQPAKCAEKLDELLTNTRSLSDLVWRLISSQVKTNEWALSEQKRLNATLDEGEPEYSVEDTFWQSLQAQDLALAMEAISEEIAFFIRSTSPPQIVEVFLKTKRVNDKLRDMAMQRQMEILDGQEVQEMVEQTMDRMAKETVEELSKTLKNSSIKSQGIVESTRSLSR